MKNLIRRKTEFLELKELPTAAQKGMLTYHSGNLETWER